MLRNILILVSLLVATVPATLHAARVSPMVVDVEPSGRASTARVTVTNPEQTPFPLEVRMFRGDISEDGELDLIPADEQFLVFPAQAVIAPNAQQVFRIQYVADPGLSKSEIYYMAVKQLPVAFQPGNPQVQIVANFNVLVNVVPGGTRADPVVEGIRPDTREEQPGVAFRIVNNGNRYFSAGSAQWTVSGTATDGSSVSLKFENGSMGNVLGFGVVSPGKARTFFIPTDKPLKAGTIELKFK